MSQEKDYLQKVKDYMGGIASRPSQIALPSQQTEFPPFAFPPFPNQVPNSWTYQSTGSTAGALTEIATDAPYLVLALLSGRYLKFWCQTDEEAVETAKKQMLDQACTNVIIMERTSTWNREWKREEGER